jgi:hypothetical protein
MAMRVAQTWRCAWHRPAATYGIVPTNPLHDPTLARGAGQPHGSQPLLSELVDLELSIHAILRRSGLQIGDAV